MNQVTYETTQNKKPASMIAETRERFQFEGPDELTELDLLNLVIGADASPIWTEYHSLTALDHAPWQEIIQQSGIGPVKATQLKAALELGWRLRQQHLSDRTVITSPEHAAHIFMESIGGEEHEFFQILMLNVKNAILAPPKTIYVGNVNSTIIRTAEVLRPAIRIGAYAIVMAHNHPSQCVVPSPEDVKATKKIIEAGRLLDIEVLDSLVVSTDSFFSMKERGVAF